MLGCDAERRGSRTGTADIRCQVSIAGRPAGLSADTFSEVVLKATCPYWPKIATTTTHYQEEKLRSRRLSTVAESVGSESGSDTDDDTVTETCSSPDTSFDSSATLTGIPEHILHLPVVPLPLPSPETFPLLLVHLHTPTRPFAPKLLGLPSSNTTRIDILLELEKRTLPELMAKLAHIHAVWKNVCTFAISDERTWGEMAMAWSCLISVVAGRGGGPAWSSLGMEARKAV